MSLQILIVHNGYALETAVLAACVGSEATEASCQNRCFPGSWVDFSTFSPSEPDTKVSNLTAHAPITYETLIHQTNDTVYDIQCVPIANFRFLRFHLWSEILFCVFLSGHLKTSIFHI